MFGVDGEETRSIFFSFKGNILDLGLWLLRSTAGLTNSRDFKINRYCSPRNQQGRVQVCGGWGWVGTDTFKDGTYSVMIRVVMEAVKQITDKWHHSMLSTRSYERVRKWLLYFLLFLFFNSQRRHACDMKTNRHNHRPSVVYTTSCRNIDLFNFTICSSYTTFFVDLFIYLFHRVSIHYIL